MGRLTQETQECNFHRTSNCPRILIIQIHVRIKRGAPVRSNFRCSGLCFENPWPRSFIYAWKFIFQKQIQSLTRPVEDKGFTLVKIHPHLASIPAPDQLDSGSQHHVTRITGSINATLDACKMSYLGDRGFNMHIWSRGVQYSWSNYEPVTWGG